MVTEALRTSALRRRSAMGLELGLRRRQSQLILRMLQLRVGLRARWREPEPLRPRGRNGRGSCTTANEGDKTSETPRRACTETP